MKTTNNTCWHLQVELLTPLHIGSGTKLVNECDYFKKAVSAVVVDQNYLFQSLANSNEDLQALVSRTTHLSDLAKIVGEEQLGLSYPLKSFEKGTPLPAKEIQAHIKDGFFRPYIPGSSLKGAIRTVLFAEWIAQQDKATIQNALPQPPLPHQKHFLKTRAAAELSQQCFAKHAFKRSKVPNFDFLRALHVGDIIFEAKDLTITDVRCLNLRGNPLQAHWKDVGTNRDERQWQDTHGIFAESLLPETHGILTLQVDNFLFENHVAIELLKLPSQIGLNDFQNFKQLLNHHAYQRLTQEHAFFKQYGVTSAAQVCQELLKQINTTTDAAYLQVGWGNGWRGITGDWMDESLEKQIRQWYSLGRVDKPFPKTRRLIIKQGQPSLPFGWLRIYSPESSQTWIQQRYQQQQQQQQIEAAKAAQAHREQQAAAQQIAAEAQRQAQLSPLERMIETVIAATPQQADYISLLQALQQGRWESQADQNVVAQTIRERMQAAKIWKETTNARKPERDKNYQRTLEVLKWLK